MELICPKCVGKLNTNKVKPCYHEVQSNGDVWALFRLWAHCEHCAMDWEFHLTAAGEHPETVISNFPPTVEKKHG